MQILVDGLTTDCPLPEIAQDLTTFNTGLALSHPPRWLIPADRRASKRISTVVLSLTGSKECDVSSRSRLAAFSATSKVKHNLCFNRLPSVMAATSLATTLYAAPTHHTVAGVLVTTPLGTTRVPPPPATPRADHAHTPRLNVEHVPSLTRHTLPSAPTVLPLSSVRGVGRMTRCTSTGGLFPLPSPSGAHVPLHLRSRDLSFLLTWFSAARTLCPSD